MKRRNFSWLCGLPIFLSVILFSASLTAWPMRNAGEEADFLAPRERLDEVAVRNRGIASHAVSDEGGEDHGYYLVPSPAEEYQRDDDQDPSWKIVDIPGRTNPLSAYVDFANHRNKMVAGIIIDEEGRTSFQESDIAETFGGTLLQYILTNHDPFVNDYYSTLKSNYGQEIADKAFPASLQKQALDFGLSSEIVFNSLNAANKEKVSAEIKLMKESSRRFFPQGIMASSSKKLIQDKSNAVSRGQNNGNLEAREAALQEAWWELGVIAENIQESLKNTPHAPAAPAPFSYQYQPDTRSRFTRATEMVIQLVDVAMLGQSSIVWGRRTAFFWGLFR